MHTHTPTTRFMIAHLTTVLLCGWVATSAWADAAKGTKARAQVAYEAGVKAYEAGDLNRARRHMIEAYKLTKAPALAFNIARVCERMSDPKPAVRFFKQYLASGKATAKEKKDIQHRIRELTRLQSRYERQVFTAPPSKDALTAEARRFFLRGVNFFKQGSYEAAVQSFVAAQRFHPSPEIAYNLAVAFERMGRNEYAADQYREYLRLKPNAIDKAAVQRKLNSLR